MWRLRSLHRGEAVLATPDGCVYGWQGPFHCGWFIGVSELAFQLEQLHGKAKIKKNVKAKYMEKEEREHSNNYTAIFLVWTKKTSRKQYWHFLSENLLVVWRSNQASVKSYSILICFKEVKANDQSPRHAVRRSMKVVGRIFLFLVLSRTFST